jgi:hypothetical protein
MNNTGTGKVDGRFRNEMIFAPLRMTIKKSRRLKLKLKISDSPRTLDDSLSVFGRTIASSNLRDEMTTIIPIRLR